MNGMPVTLAYLPVNVCEPVGMFVVKIRVVNVVERGLLKREQ